jgi:hypothetical protein
MGRISRSLLCVLHTKVVFGEPVKERHLHLQIKLDNECT